MAIQLPTQPSERLNVPAPVFPAKRPTAVRVMPPPAPTECNVPSGSTAPLPPLMMIFPPIILAGNEPVCGQPALVKIHAPSKLLSPCCGGERGVSSEGDFGSFRGSDRNDNLTLPTRAWVCAGSEATTSKADNNAVLGHIRTIPSSEIHLRQRFGEADSVAEGGLDRKRWGIDSRTAGICGRQPGGQGRRFLEIEACSDRIGMCDPGEPPVY
jgi:hypothetical protein